MSTRDAENQCLQEQKLRNDFCCNPVTCIKQGFLPCTDNNQNDVCVPCPDGQHVLDTYETKFFDSSPCIEKPSCDQEEIRDADGKCVCDRARGYYRKGTQDSICAISQGTCNSPGQELSETGSCKSCQSGYFKEKNDSSICIAKSKIICSEGEILDEGGTTSDRKCVPITTAYPSTMTSINSPTSTTQKPSSDTGLNGMTLGICLSVLFVIIVIIIIIYKRRKSSHQRATKEAEQRDPESVALRGNQFAETIPHYDGGFQHSVSNGNCNHSGLTQTESPEERTVKRRKSSHKNQSFSEVRSDNEDNLLDRAEGGDAVDDQIDTTSLRSFGEETIPHYDGGFQHSVSNGNYNHSGLTQTKSPEERTVKQWKSSHKNQSFSEVRSDDEDNLLDRAEGGDAVDDQIDTTSLRSFGEEIKQNNKTDALRSKQEDIRTTRVTAVVHRTPLNDSLNDHPSIIIDHPVNDDDGRLAYGQYSMDLPRGDGPNIMNTVQNNQPSGGRVLPVEYESFHTSSFGPIHSSRSSES